LKKNEKKPTPSNKLHSYFNNCVKSGPTKLQLIDKSLKQIKIEPKTLNSKIKVMNLLTNQNEEKIIESVNNKKRSK
jgi:hypothetical protein